LEYSDSHVLVHDVLYEWVSSEWRLKVSTYRKLRLSPSWLTARLEDQGLDVAIDTGSAGMVRLVARQEYPSGEGNRVLV
jgi:hypothetical protein